MADGRKRRIRLEDQSKKQSVKALHEGRDRSFKEARKLHGGKIPQGYTYKSLLDGYREMGRKPKVIDGKQAPTREPSFVVQPGMARRIVRLIRRGMPYTAVCRYVGITPKTFKDWLEKGRSGYSPEYVNFYRKICRAEARAEMETLKSLRRHRSADWRVSAWELERRWPENWSKKDRLVAETHVNATVNIDSKSNLSTVVISDEEARELARKMIDGSEFGYARLPAPTGEDR